MLTTCLVYVQYDFEDLPRRIQKLQRQSPSLMSICVKRETQRWILERKQTLLSGRLLLIKNYCRYSLPVRVHFVVIHVFFFFLVCDVMISRGRSLCCVSG